MRKQPGVLAFLLFAAACSSSPGDKPTPGADGGGSGGSNDAGPITALDGGLGTSPLMPGDLDPPSHGGTITFQSIGATGWFPSRRDPASGECDAYQSASCCLAKNNITSDAL